MLRSAVVVAAGALLWSLGEATGQPAAAAIENPSGEYLVWGDYRFQVNQHGDLGRNWPTPDLVWEQFELLREKARANPEPPNTLRAVLLVIPRVNATAVREDGTVSGRRSSEMTPAEVKWALDQWRRFEEMVYVYSGGNAWVRTDVKVIDEPLEATTDENWVFWPGQQRELLARYIPFDRGDYQSYNAIYSSKGLNADPHGGTIGADYGIKGCGTSDNAYYGEHWKPNRTGYVALHEWMNQQCAATSNVMPYPEGEALWNNYVLHKIGYHREDTALDDWPWLTARRDTMLHIIRPGMWRRWTAIDPYVSLAIGEWLLLAPAAEPGDVGPAGRARALSAAPDDAGRLISMPIERYTHFDLARASAADGLPAVAGGIDAPGVYYLRTYIASDAAREVRLWAGADERFRLYLDGEPIRDGWGWNYSEDDGRLTEKVTYLDLERGVSTLLLELPSTAAPVEFRVRLCDTDGSGRPPPGVSTFATLERAPSAVAAGLGEVVPRPIGEPEPQGFTRPRLHSWADVGDMPWTRLPRLGEAELRELTGIPSLRIVTTGPSRSTAEGEEYAPEQHLLLDVPAHAVRSPWIAAPAEDSGALNNDLDFNWKSAAWLRVPGRPGPEKDVVLLRFDAAEPLMHLLRTRGRAGEESIVGWVLVEHKLAYVLLVDLDVSGPPGTVLGLLREGAVRPAK